MALVIEDGSIVANADSYVSRAEVIAYAADRGVTVANNDTTDQSYIRPAWDYINSLELRLQGFRSDEFQTGAFPRDGMDIRGYYVDPTEIPEVVKELQKSLAMELSQGTDIWNRPLSASNPVRRNEVKGVVSREYAVRNRPAILAQSRSLALIAELTSRSSSVTLTMG